MSEHAPMDATYPDAGPSFLPPEVSPVTPAPTSASESTSVPAPSPVGYAGPLPVHEPVPHAPSPVAGQLPDHPDATSVVVLGAVGMVVGVTGFIGWYLSSRAKREIEAGAPYHYGGTLQIGRVLSIITSVLCLLWIAGVVVFTLLPFVVYALI
ncbi:hypothetical protein [uncultured Tessaracoccus sp.]|uniref:hypothetical protein n=1 Tax=uncultured Tessaracoccus sp. TaxID=905023 RepID=UPI00260149C1|nr:hypothetical protein [uncultured Tessaracoccus sp.]